MVAEAVMLGVVLLAVAAEWLHGRRCRRVARLAFGPSGRPSAWARFAPLVRIASLGALAWGLTTLYVELPRARRSAGLADEQKRHLLLVLDVSPSMRLEDAGPTGKQSRVGRVSDLMQSFFERTLADQFFITVVAVYNGAKPVVEKTTDMEVVRHILDELPMHYAFHSGETRLFDGLEEAARIARPWRPDDATLLLLTDGDTVPATGMPEMPASIDQVLVVGVGDPQTGGFLNGRHSRQDVSTLRQIAVRLRGEYHNGNEKHIPSETLRLVTQSSTEGRRAPWGRREYALLACGLGGFLYALLPVLLHWMGTSWRPGVRRGPSRDNGADRRAAAPEMAGV